MFAEITWALIASAVVTFCLLVRMQRNERKHRSSKTESGGADERTGVTSSDERLKQLLIDRLEREGPITAQVTFTLGEARTDPATEREVRLAAQDLGFADAAVRPEENDETEGKARRGRAKIQPEKGRGSGAASRAHRVKPAGRRLTGKDRSDDE
ncbi:hypothetical protein AB0N14_27395 [Streptomyces sp. NPDC051104]|uniref:hypothetical protein n=1 Tax=Streptomyces sp. NPDC051104 TaxID=3155044 RepID=UPI0034265B5C